MQAKTFEVRDIETFIPVLATKLEPENEADRYLLVRGKCKIGAIYLLMLTGGFCITNCDSNNYANRTMKEAHLYIEKNFDTLESGAVIDVQYILGETKFPKKSEKI